MRFQFFSRDFIESLEMSEKVSVAFAYQLIGKEDGVKFNVLAAEIEQPRNLGNIVVEEISIGAFIELMRGSSGHRSSSFQLFRDEFVL